MFFSFFGSRNLLLFAFSPWLWGKGSRWLTREGLSQRPWYQVGEPGLRAELGSLASCAVGVSAFPGGTNLAGLQRLVRWSPHPGGGASGKYRDGGSVWAEPRVCRSRVAWFKHFSRPVAASSALSHLSGGGSGMSGKRRTPPLPLRWLCIFRGCRASAWEEWGREHLQGHIVASNQSPQRGGCWRPAQQWLTTSSSGWNNSYGSGSASSWSAVRGSLQKWCWVVLEVVTWKKSRRWLEKGSVRSKLCWSGDGAVWTPRWLCRLVLPHLSLSSPTVF